MKTTLPDMDLVVDDTALNTRSVKLFGFSFHNEPHTLIDKYTTTPLNDFLANETRYSCGNYVLVDNGVKDDGIIRIITSLGYSGGYIYQTDNHIYISTILSNILRNIDLNDVRFDTDALFRYYYKPAEDSFLPFTTIFKDIDKLPPAFIVEIEHGQIRTKRSYFSYSKLEPPRSFADALNETMEMVAQSVPSQNVRLMLSGGIDSTSLLLSLKKAYKDAPFHVSTIDYGNYSNNPMRAKLVAESLGIDIEDAINISRHPNLDAVTENDKLQIKLDFISPGSPDHYFTNEYSKEDDLIIAGQNMDSVAILSMRRRQLSFMRYIMKTGDIKEVFNAIFRNYQFSDRYISSHIVPRLYCTLPKLRTLLPNNSLKIDPSFSGYLQGYLSTGFPNIITKKFGYKLVEKEIEIFFRTNV